MDQRIIELHNKSLILLDRVQAYYDSLTGYIRGARGCLPLYSSACYITDIKRIQKQIDELYLKIAEYKSCDGDEVFDTLNETYRNQLERQNELQGISIP